MSGSEIDALLQPVAAGALRAEAIRLQCFSTSDSLQLHEHFNDFITQPLCLVAACSSVQQRLCRLQDCHHKVPQHYIYFYNQFFCYVSNSPFFRLSLPPFHRCRHLRVCQQQVQRLTSVSEVRRHIEAEINHALLADLSHACSGQLPPSTLALQVFPRSTCPNQRAFDV
jgi:hypothetical protein